jgi:hypothetical protein
MKTRIAAPPAQPRPSLNGMGPEAAFGGAVVALKKLLTRAQAYPITYDVPAFPTSMDFWTARTLSPPPADGRAPIRAVRATYSVRCSIV